jgi:eukaryotic-like serine/threonine-protein kinase
MAIPSGTRLGSYEVAALIGAGGMGEVYQAHDTKLGRDVAIKVLPEAFSHDPERLSRFRREAKMLASLNHPNIATIHGLEESNGRHYLVMELVRGETLTQRVKRDGPVPIEEALTIVKQIAEALEAAHNSEKGIIHRDLKPANVKVTPQGRVRVLDFGLAKAFADEPTATDIENLPTLSMAPTERGVILGTAAYMSPEQARGKPVDKRTDIWAFGCLLYELLTGRTAFRGETFSDTIAAVIEREPDWQALPPATPATIRDRLGSWWRRRPCASGVVSVARLPEACQKRHRHAPRIRSIDRLQRFRPGPCALTGWPDADFCPWGNIRDIRAARTDLRQDSSEWRTGPAH